MSDGNPPASAVADAPPASPEAHSTPSATQEPAETRKVEGQRQYLLQQLMNAPGHRLSQKDANRKISAAAKKALGLTGKLATRLRGELAAEDFIRVIKEKKSVSYELTDQGRQHAQTLTPYPLPAARGRGKVAEVSPDVRNQQKAYLLFQLFRAGGKWVGRKEANRFSNAAGKALKLNSATADQLWRELANEGRVETQTVGRTISYSLTPAGTQLLGELRQHDALPVNKLTGKHINQLLDAARSAAQVSAGHHAGATEAAHPPATPPPADLGRAALAESEELRREKYSHTGLVPIHEVRARIASKYGPPAARHDVLDEPIRQLGRDRRVRLVPLSDLSKATAEQLNDSIPGVNETLFYIEAVHE